ncbi:Aldo/keto reductase [Scenedesmus sp. NREL 46B-D3]|nr:Aldo/keto reductase [Scenedesmus sp. NREL 46B-D3]
MDKYDMISLANGVDLPLIGLGTFKARGESLKQAIRTALQHGIRHIDTASIYKNEDDIAAVLKEQGVPRQDVFITSKVSPYEQGTEKATLACQQILHRLQTDYVDLVLVHWPGVARADAASPRNAELRWQTWQVLEQMQRQGKARAIGVSNYSSSHLRELVARAAVKPAVNQFELHPRRQEGPLRQACAAAGVAVVAYASLGCGHLLQQPVVRQVAARTGKTEAQVLLRWALQQGCAVIPKSVHPQYIQQHSPQQLLSWQLSDDDMAALSVLEDGHKYCWDASDIL